MNLKFSILFLLVVGIQACQNHASIDNAPQFLSSDDTLVIRTKKIKGSGLFKLGASSLSFKDSSEIKTYSLILPEEIFNINLARKTVDFRDKESDFIDIIFGLKDNEEIFIVDQNNNQDFTDDSIRFLKQLDWSNPEESIKCNFLFFNGQETIQDSSWVRIGISRDRFWYGRDEHLLANFRIEKNSFTVGIIDDVFGSSFNYGANPEIALLVKNSNRKDTLHRKDLLKRGEYLDFNGMHYRFDSITNNGKYIRLIKELNFKSKTGTQVGMIAPNFDCVTVEKDTISSSNLQNKPVVIANTCGCGGDKESTKAFVEIKNTFGDNLFVFRLDSNIKDDLNGWQIDTEEEFNKDFYDKYRQAYCSRIAYIIGNNKRIVDKFDITDWRKNLAKHISFSIDESNN